MESARLVAGVDGTERSRDALALATRLTDPGQRLLPTHVHSYGRLANLLSAGEYEQLVREVADSTFMAVRETLAPDAQRELRLLSNPSPAAGLQEIAQETGASVIVVGSSHRSGLGRVLAGSLTESVLAGAPVPVAVAPLDSTGTDRGLLTIGCGFDGSPESCKALTWAAHLARRRRARLVALAVHTRVAFGGVSTGGVMSHQSANDALRAELDEQLDEAVAAHGHGMEASGRLLDGDAASDSPRQAPSSTYSCSARAATGLSAACCSAASHARSPAPPPAPSSCCRVRSARRVTDRAPEPATDSR